MAVSCSGARRASFFDRKGADLSFHVTRPFVARVVFRPNPSGKLAAGRGELNPRPSRDRAFFLAELGGAPDLLTLRDAK